MLELTAIFYERGAILIVRLTGHFDSSAQPELRNALNWVEGPVIIDLRHAWLSAAALAELVWLAHRLGNLRVTIANPSPLLRRLIVDTKMDRVLHLSPCDEPLPAAPNTYTARLHRAAPRPQVLTRSDCAARLDVRPAW
jgi:anti-anti-sigma regulatory factor